MLIENETMHKKNFLGLCLNQLCPTRESHAAESTVCAVVSVTYIRRTVNLLFTNSTILMQVVLSATSSRLYCGWEISMCLLSPLCKTFY